MDRKSRMEKAEGDRWESEENTVAKVDRDGESAGQPPNEMPGRYGDETEADRAGLPDRGRESDQRD